MKKTYDMVLAWAEARGIIPNGRSTTQFIKLTSELGELSQNLLDSKDIKDDIGDCLVVLTSICKLEGSDLMELLDTLPRRAIGLMGYHARYLYLAEASHALGNLGDNLIKDNWLEAQEDVKMFVQALNLLAHSHNTTLSECFEVAYEDIKDRKGFLTAEGNFIKETDPNYNRLLKGVTDAKA